MLMIDDTLVSEELLDEEFVCDLSACKGACCVEGDAGAPLEEKELAILDDIYDEVKEYLTPAGRKAIEKQGRYVMDEQDGEFVTPLIKGKECAYTIFENGVAFCGIEKAWKDGKTDFQKPVSCHLYPVRITKYKNYDAVNYHRWQICTPACACGSKLKVPVFRFVKDALVRKYGEQWFEQLAFAQNNRE